MAIIKSIFKAYDVRGLYPQEVNTESIALTGKALADMWQSGTIAVAHDGRHGSDILARTIADAITAHGKEVGKQFTIIPIGLSTTPMFYFLVNHLGVAGGAMITASHNPKEYNGVKAVLPGAVMIRGTEILKQIEAQSYAN